MSKLEHESAIFWLGQAGFWIDLDGVRILIDPYLSDSLAKKYEGKLFPHIRMMPPPFTVATLPEPDIVLITHAHTDHMDPETLGPLAQQFPNLKFYVPVATRDIAIDRIGNENALRFVNAGDEIAFDGGLSVSVFPSAHEALDQTEEGYFPYLGYGLAKNEHRLYHSGDTIPFAGLEQLIKAFAPKIAMLPINGRDAYRKSHGVPGNMTAKEALAFCANTNIAGLIPHHFGMFEFNTADPAELISLGGTYI